MPKWNFRLHRITIHAVHLGIFSYFLPHECFSLKMLQKTFFFYSWPSHHQYFDKWPKKSCSNDLIFGYYIDRYIPQKKLHQNFSIASVFRKIFDSHQPTKWQKIKVPISRIHTPPMENLALRLILYMTLVCNRNKEKSK